MRTDSGSRASASRLPPQLPMWRRWLYLAVGLLSLALGLLGVLLPGLPTTPFVLLSAACFMRASPRMHRWLLKHRWLGPPLRDWERHRSLPRRVRRIALGSMTLMVGISVWFFAGRPLLQAALLLAGALGAWVVLRIPVRQPAALAQSPSRLK